MIVIRSTFTARPGQSGKLLAQLKAMASAGDLKNVTYLTDISGDFNQVVMVHEVDSMSDFEAMMEQYRTDAKVQAAAKGYTDLWVAGRREFFRKA